MEPAKQLSNPVKQRIIKLISINDENVYEMVDRGISKTGDDTDSRAAIKNALSKRVDVDGQRLPVFLVAEPPAALHPNDPMDRDIIFDRAGKLLGPYPEWSNARAQNLDARRARAARAQNVVDQRTAADVLRALKAAISPGAMPLIPAPAAPPADGPPAPEPSKKK